MASSSHIKPGERGSIKVSVNVHNYVGRIKKEIRVNSNDPSRPSVILTIAAEVMNN